MNHAELYTTEQRADAIKSIKIFEKSPDLYFYIDKVLYDSEKDFVSLIGQYVEESKLHKKMQREETCIITAIDHYGSVALCSLNSISSNHSLEKLTRQLNVKQVVFYAELKYDVTGMKMGPIEVSDFAWKKGQGCATANGTLFSAFLDNNPILKLEAYQRSEQYQIERYQRLDRKAESRKYLDEKNIDSIRDAALVLEKENLKLAYNLMSIAHEGRPSGPFIKKKLDEYRSLLGS